ncbi:MAG: winged helix DNA-binding domain-containing protein [Chloroflexota bacterium]
MISLEQQQVFRWRLKGHQLLERAPRNRLVDVVSKVGGLQAQVMSAAELQAWARIEGITAQDVRDALWKERTLYKSWSLRGTLHLLAASEFALYTAALSTRHRHASAGWLKYYGLTLEEMQALMEGVRKALDGRSLTRDQLGDEIAEIMKMPHLKELMKSGWGSLLKPSAFQGDLCFGPSSGQNVNFVRPDQWLDGGHKGDDSPEAMKEMVRRYLAAFGPASVDDFARWFGMEAAGARRVFKAMDDELVPVEVEGWAKWKGWARKDSVPEMQTLDVNPPARLLPHFDPYVVARSHIAAYAMPDVEANKEKIYRTAGWVTPVVLVDGVIAGMWGYEKRRSNIEVKVQMFSDTSAEVKAEIEEEASRLADFLEGKAELVIGRET